jgi:serine/threonine protein kinase
MRLARLAHVYQSVVVNEYDFLSRGGYLQVCTGVRKAVHDRNGDWDEIEVAVHRPVRPLTDHREKQLFLRKVEVMTNADHPACLPILACDTPADGNFSIVTERMTGSLQMIINDAPRGMAPPGWNATTKSIAALGIAAGMAHLHAKHIIHQGLSAGNVLLDSDLRPRVAGFGLAKILTPGKPPELEAGVGVFPYMAPEIWREEEYGFPVDVYAYGILLYQILTDTNPFPAIGPDELRNKVCDGERPKIPAWVARFYSDLMERCWKPVPAERPTFTEIIARADEFQLDGCDEGPFDEYKSEILKLG